MRREEGEPAAAVFPVHDREGLKEKEKENA
jgi:hypothetical protein